MSKGHNKSSRVIKKNPHLINREIKASEVKLIIEGEEPEVMSFNEAIRFAESENKDLVLVSANANPPVVKLMDYTKYLYELGKKTQTKPKPMKEVRFTPNTDANDLAFKTKHIIGFLEKGHKVKVFVFFKGREITYKERGEKLLLELAVTLEEYASVESMPTIDGKKMYMFLKPKPKA